MARLVDELKYYLAENIAELVADDVLTDGNTRTDSIDPDKNGLQVVLFHGAAGVNPYGGNAQSLSVAIEIFADEDTAYLKADLIRKLFRDTPEFNTASYRIIRAGIDGDVERRGLFKAGLINYGVDLTLQYHEV